MITTDVPIAISQCGVCVLVNFECEIERQEAEQVP